MNINDEGNKVLLNMDITSLTLISTVTSSRVRQSAIKKVHLKELRDREFIKFTSYFGYF